MGKSIGTLIYEKAQEEIQLRINLTARPQRWGIARYTSPLVNRYDLVGYNSTSGIQVESNSIWSSVWWAARQDPKSIHAEALSFIARNSPVSFARIKLYCEPRLGPLIKELMEGDAVPWEKP